MGYALGIVFVLFFSVAGVVFLVGANRRWRWLVDPPPELWLCYSQSLVRRVFGERTVIAYTYIMGILFLAASMVGLYNGLTNTH